MGEVDFMQYKGFVVLSHMFSRQLLFINAHIEACVDIALSSS